jgi:hypothetical protein
VSSSAQQQLLQQLATAPNPFEILIPRYARKPRLFVREVLGAAPDAWQDEALEALEKGHTRISIRSGHGVGKSTFLSWVIIWFAATRYPFKCVITAPSASQLYDALWSEILAWLRRLPENWRSLWSITSDRIELKAAPAEAFVSARTSRKEVPEALAGVHSAAVLLVADEASGIPEEVFESGSGSMSTRGAITLLTGNPTRASGFFFRTHTVERDHWFCMRVNSETSPRVDPKFVEEIARRYGRDSRAYRVRVLGEFPTSDEDTLIPMELVEAAWTREIVEDPEAREVWGVDVARFGADASVLVRRRGNVVPHQPSRWRGLDTMGLTGRLVALWERTPVHERPTLIAVDVIGIGAGVVDRLRELELPVAGVNVSEAAPTAGRYARLRDELWDRGKEWLETRRVRLVQDEILRDELTAPRYQYLSTGLLKVESKDELRRRLPQLGSPDSADAFNLTFIPRAAVATTAGGSWRQALRRNVLGR